MEQRGESNGFGKEMPEDKQCVCKLILEKSFLFNFLGKFKKVSVCDLNLQPGLSVWEFKNSTLSYRK